MEMVHVPVDLLLDQHTASAGLSGWYACIQS